MSSLASIKPPSWTQIVGQTRAITVLQSILSSAKFLPRGILFVGTWGVGKTSSAYLMARALTCTGDDSLGCGKCLSCKTIAEYGLDQHSDFTEIDAASHPGVEYARTLLDNVKINPLTGKRRVIVIDEAHRLSRDAWDAYLKPLDLASKSNNVQYPIFLFVSNDADAIPKTIKSRCAIVKFSKVSSDVMLGLLCNLCTSNKIQYELDGLKAIARLSGGHVRDALNYLDTVATVGHVTKSLVTSVLDDTLDDHCMKILLAVVNKNLVEAAQLCDIACGDHLPNQIIDGMFSLYARSLFAPEGSSMMKIIRVLSNIPDVSAAFLRWTNSQYLTADALPLLIAELIDLIGVPTSTVNRAATPLMGKPVSAAELMEIMGAIDITDIPR